MHEAATDAHFQIVTFLNLDVDALLAKAVDTLGLSKEQDLHFFLLRVRIDEIGERFLDDVALLGNVGEEQLLHMLLCNEQLSAHAIELLLHVL